MHLFVLCYSASGGGKLDIGLNMKFSKQNKEVSNNESYWITNNRKNEPFFCFVVAVVVVSALQYFSY